MKLCLPNLLLLALCSSGCLLNRNNWPGIDDGKRERTTEETKVYPGADLELTSLSLKIQQRDGTNFLGQYMGMIAEWDGWTNKVNFQGEPKQPPFQGVMMFSATSGECLKWISAQDFTNIFVLKTRREYP